MHRLRNGDKETTMVRRLYTVYRKKESTFFLNKFNKFKLTFTSFGTHYAGYGLLKRLKLILSICFLGTSTSTTRLFSSFFLILVWRFVRMQRMHYFTRYSGVTN